LFDCFWSITSGRLPTAATTAAAAATTATATARTTAAGGTLLRFVNTERTPAHVFAIQRLNGASRIGAGHFDEAEATWTSRFAIIDERDGFHGAMSFKQLAHLTFVCRERQVTNIDLCHINTVSLK
jgi:hypothetical protein